MKRIYMAMMVLLIMLMFSTAVKAKEERAAEQAIGIQSTTPVRELIKTQEPAVAEGIVKADDSTKMQYAVGIADILDINILQPEKLNTIAPVSLDGSINFPYIGNVQVKGMTLDEIKDTIQKRLSEGYIKYPVVSVSLRESRSRKFFVYGEVVKPGQYPIEENTTLLKAISMAGGFTKFGSSSSVKVLRPKKDNPGYQAIKVNVNAAMKGSSAADILIQPGDIIVISEGIF